MAIERGVIQEIKESLLKMDSEKSARLDAMTVGVERSGNTITVPSNIPLSTAIEALENQRKADEQMVSIREELSGCVPDAAHAFSRALERTYRWVRGVPQQGFFGEEPPTLISVQSGVGTSVHVPWGVFEVPGIDGKLKTEVASKSGNYHMVILARVKRKDQEKVKQLMELTRKILREESLYRSKAVQVRFLLNNGVPVEFVEPTFWDVSDSGMFSLILPNEVERQVRASLFTPLTHTEKCREAGIPLKRGILLCGTYGTGKTMTARVAAHLAERNGWTFIYCEKANELAHAVKFAASYQPAVVFCEDIDREASGERDEGTDELLNIIDGITSKKSEIIVVLTSNNVESIEPALLRPGRLDAVIHFSPPDSAAVQRLIQVYAGSNLQKNQNLERVGEVLAGQIPAVIREVVERAKLHSLAEHGKNVGITETGLLSAAEGMRYQLQLLAPKVPAVEPAKQFVDHIASAVIEKMNGQLSGIEDRIAERLS